MRQKEGMASSASAPVFQVEEGAGKIRRKASPTKAEILVADALRRDGWETIEQPTRLFPLPGWGTYTPDILAWKPGKSGILVVEVKGGYKGPGAEQGMERYARAAGTYDCPAWRFFLATVDRNAKVVNLKGWGDREEAPSMKPPESLDG